MRKGVVTIGFALIACLMPLQIAFAQETTAPTIGTWDGLKSIPPGDVILVNLRNGQRIKGRLSSVTDSNLTIAEGKKTTDLSRGDVLKVFRLIPKSTKRATLIGLAVGMGIGAGTGAIWEAGQNGEPGEHLGIGIGMGLGAGFGALAGYLAASGKRQVLVYEIK